MSAIQQILYENIESIPGIGVLRAQGQTVPTDASKSYAHGCIFHHTDGTTEADAIYINVGDEDSCNFDALDVNAAESALLSGITAGTGAASKVLSLDANGDVTMPDLGSIGFGSVGKISWDTTDANANELLIQLPAGGAVDVPVIVIGQAIEGVDLGLYNGVTEPRLAIFSSGAVTTGPVLEMRKARGTTASPTVVTSGDDLGTISFYGAVAAGEYVLGASIEADMAGTIATTRGPSTLTFKTATDAAPSVLTTAMTISAAQVVTIASGVSVT